MNIRRLWQVSKFMNKRHYQGFTLLEALVALLVLLLTCSFFTGLLKGLERITENDATHKHMEWHVFLNQLTNELSNLTLVEVGEDYLKLVEKGPDNTIKRTTVEHYYRGQMLRKSTNLGHHPLLLQVKKVQFKEVETGMIEIKVELLNGERKQGRICLEKKQDP